MNSIELLRRGAKKALFSKEELDDDEWSALEKAHGKFAELLHLIDVGRLDIHGVTPAELVRVILKTEKSCGCASCRTWNILN